MFMGQQLKEYRRKRHWTQAQLGEATCMSREAISKIEAQNRVISDIATLKSFQQALNIPYGVIGFIPIEVFVSA